MMMNESGGGCGGLQQRVLMMLLLIVCVALFPLMARGSGLSYSKRRYCDVERSFPQFEDQSFVEMLNKLLEESRSISSGVKVVARDQFELFEGSAVCLGHNCQMYDSECYSCDSMRDADACLEAIISELELSLRDSSSEGHCVRTREFATGERVVAVDDAATMFQVCGIQYRYLGSTLALGSGRRSVY